MASTAMPFDHILGQPAAVATLTRALEGGKLHHAYRFEGPRGVGKELAAIAFAAALVCTSNATLGCGACDACRRAITRSERPPEVPLHPDVVLVGRGVYPPESIGGKKESSEISVEQVRRVVLSRAPYAPHEARRQVFVIRDAEELSTSAANALLKTLEEPRPGTQFVLTTSEPQALLDTIRSRTLPVRFAALPGAALERILRDRGVDGERLARAIELAGGSAGRAVELADPEAGAARDAFVQGMQDAMRTPGLGAAIAFAEGGDHDRAWLVQSLRALAAVFVREGRQQAGASPIRARVAAERYVLVLDAIEAIERNGQAAVVLSGLVASLKAGRQLRPGTPPGAAHGRR